MTLYRTSPRLIAPTLETLREGWVPPTLLGAVQRAWHDAVGEVIAAEAFPVSERLGTITVSCSSAGWAQELELMGPTLLARLNEHLRGGRVTRLRCTTGRPADR